jgi:hypothetical protein
MVAARVFQAMKTWLLSRNTAWYSVLESLKNQNFRQLSARTRLMRFLNTAGPVNPELHYCLPPLGRLNWDELLLLIEQQKYFVLHAPANR